MTQHDDKAYLGDMLRYARRAARAIPPDTTFSDFQQNETLQDAASYAILVIGEAAGSVSEETEEMLPDIPWRSIVGMRNRLAHGYFDINLAEIWKIIHEDLPPLIAQLEPLLPDA